MTLRLGEAEPGQRECFQGQRHRRRRPGEGEDRRSASTRPRARRSEQKRLRAQRPQEAEPQDLARTEERRLMHHSQPMDPCVCSAACKAAPEADPAIRSKQPRGGRRSCLPQQRPRLSRALAGTRRGGALTQRRPMKFWKVRPLTVQASRSARASLGSRLMLRPGAHAHRPVLASRETSPLSATADPSPPSRLE